jgi:hypothetical protein
VNRNAKLVSPCEVNSVLSSQPSFRASLGESYAKTHVGNSNLQITPARVHDDFFKTSSLVIAIAGFRVRCTGHFSAKIVHARCDFMIFFCLFNIKRT